MTRGWRFKMVGVLAAASLALAAAGCYGKFALVKKVYDFNGKVENKYARSAVTWVLIIIPVYEISSLVDFLVLNTIEFWSGKNPAMAEASTKVQVVDRGADRYIQTVTSRSSGIETQITHYRDGQLVNRLVVRQSADSPTVTGTLVWAGSSSVERYTVRPTLTGATVKHTGPAGVVSTRAVSSQELARLGADFVQTGVF